MICIAGKNEIAIYGIELLLSRGISKDNIVGMINSSDKGINDWQPSFKNYCEIQKIQIVTQKEIYGLSDLILISLEYDKILDTRKYNSSRLYNIHFSLLPKYKGMYTSIFPILNGEKYSGVTLHKIDLGIDTGEIIDQLKFEIPSQSNGLDLYFNYLKYSKVLLEKNIDNLVYSIPKSSQQSFFDSSYNSKNSIDFKSLNIDFKKTCFQLCNFVNAFTFRPYQLLNFENQQICRAIPTSEKSTDSPGIIIEEDTNSFRIATIDYNVILLKDKIVEILNASEKNNLEVLRELNNLGYKLNEKNELGWDSLIVSCFNNSFDCVKFILNNRLVDVNSVNINGTTAAMYAMTNASKSNDLRILKLLIEHEANLHKRDFSGHNIFYYANKYANNKVIDFLSQYE